MGGRPLPSGAAAPFESPARGDRKKKHKAPVAPSLCGRHCGCYNPKESRTQATMPPTPSIEERVSHVEQDLAKLKVQVDRVSPNGSSAETGPCQSTNPWLEGAGMFRDDPLFDDWQQAIAEYRRE